MTSAGSSVVLAPNPVKDILTVTLYPGKATSAVQYKISIVDNLGNALITSTTQQKINAIPIAKLAPGYYFLAISSDEGETMVRPFFKL